MTDNEDSSIARKVRYIYLMVDADPGRHRFKIGVSVWPRFRATSVCPRFCPERSVQVGYKPEHAANGEAVLHKHFAAYRLSPDPAFERTGQGVTEWFSLDCYLDVLQILSDSRYVIAPQKIADMPHKDPATVRESTPMPSNSRRTGRKAQINIKVTTETRRNLYRLADERNVTLGEILELALRAFEQANPSSIPA